MFQSNFHAVTDNHPGDFRDGKGLHIIYESVMMMTLQHICLF